MKLEDLKVGDTACIKEIHAGKELKRRLNSFGILKGTTIKIKAITLQKNTYELEVNRTMVALRRAEVNKLEVEPCSR